ncbi:MAG TPA: transporter substrate-binding domain-containing protein [Stellaceae bacterium]|jgi:ABC-type amino acid transport substrate-binding protein|nr:transporter substrate-binding domain-containing protein [Stellaceae bacterium]
MLRRRTLFGLGLAGLGGLPRLARAAAASPAAPDLAPDIARIRDRGRLVVAVAGFATPPFVSIGSDGKPEGTDIDAAAAMAAALGVGLEFDHRAGNYNEIIDIVAAHEADFAISKLSETLDRALKVRFSTPYLVLRHALLLNRLRFAQTAKGRDPVEVVQEFNASIAVVAGTAYVEYAKRLLPHARIREYPDWPASVAAVLKGEVVAAYRDELEVKHILTAYPEAPLQLRPAILTDTRDPIGIVLPWDSTQLLAWVDFYLENAAKPLSVDQLLARYDPRSAKKDAD